jgi:hypothetical protein
MENLARAGFEIHDPPSWGRGLEVDVAPRADDVAPRADDVALRGDEAALRLGHALIMRL